jgi:hypothetical protein
MSDTENRNTVAPKDPNFDVYLNMMKYLTHQMLQQEDFATRTQLADYTGIQIDNKTNSFFFTRKQAGWMQSRRLSLVSTFGTGKTTLLKIRAKDLLEEDRLSKVVFVIFGDAEATKHSLLVKSYQEQFKACAERVTVEPLRVLQGIRVDKGSGFKVHRVLQGIRFYKGSGFKVHRVLQGIRFRGIRFDKGSGFKMHRVVLGKKSPK